MTAFSCHQEEAQRIHFLYGSYQHTEDTSLYFSIGLVPIGKNKINTVQYFYSVKDSIYDNFYELDRKYDSDSKQSLITTSDNQHLMIHHITDTQIGVYGPSEDMEDLQTNANEYKRLPEGIQILPDSVLFPPDWCRHL